MNIARHFFGVDGEKHEDYLESIGIEPLEIFQTENVEHLADCTKMDKY